MIWTFVESIGRTAMECRFVLLTCVIPAFAAAEIQRDSTIPATSGLIWNRSGLPAVFPLQVKTSAGQDYFLTLLDEGTKKEALAAYIVGGTFFKVLVPPGKYTLRFSFGDVWQGEEHLFGLGSNTGDFELEDPLTFKIYGAGTKAGHLVDITEFRRGRHVQAKVKGQFICQALRTEFFPPLEARYTRELAIQNGTGNHSNRSFSGEFRMLGNGPYARPENRQFFYSRYEVISRYCE